MRKGLAAALLANVIGNETFAKMAFFCHGKRAGSLNLMSRKLENSL